jgi:hypothetical protein
MSPDELFAEIMRLHEESLGEIMKVKSGEGVEAA